MTITHFGLSSFLIQSKTNNGDTKSIIINPFSADTGLKAPNLEASILIIGSNEKYIIKKNITGSPHVIDRPGEYDVKNVGIKGIQVANDPIDNEAQKNSIIYRISLEEMSLIHLGHINRVLTAEELSELNGTDILMVPVGSNGVLNAKKAKEVISQIEPRMVIPMLYKMNNSIIDFDELSIFTKETSLEPTQEDKLKIHKKDLPQEDTELVILNPKQ